MSGEFPGSTLSSTLRQVPRAGGGDPTVDPLGRSVPSWSVSGELDAGS
jgi:hypothetical protein